MQFIKSISYKYWFILLFSLTSIGCLSGTRPDVRLSPTLDKRLYQITPLPLTVGIYIEPTLRNYVQEVPLKQDDAGMPYYVFPNFIFPIGETLSSKIEEMSRILFKKAILIDSLQNKEFLNKEVLDGILVVSLKNSEIELHMDVSVWRAVGRHNLSITASFLNPQLNKLWNSEIAVEGKGFDFISSRVEQEWWMTTGPNFAYAVDDAVQKLTYELAQKLITSKEISEMKNQK